MFCQFFQNTLFHLHYNFCLFAGELIHQIFVVAGVDFVTRSLGSIQLHIRTIKLHKITSSNSLIANAQFSITEVNL